MSTSCIRRRWVGCHSPAWARCSTDPLATRKKNPALDQVVMLMAGYAQRSVFRSYSQLPAHDGALAFKVTWHGDLEFDILVDAVSKTISIPRVLPGVTADLCM